MDAVFYKPAFYDRKAHAHLERRYRIHSYLELGDGTLAVTVRDADKEIHRFGTYAQHDYQACRVLESDARAWLDKEFPDHSDPTAYW